ncbi:MAG: UDP-glucose 4-epimerase GalE [Bacteroidales bacterium]
MGAVLVTGGAGYIGSHAAKLLRQAGRDVVIYDNLSAGHRQAALGAELVEGDVHDTSRLRDVIRRHGVAAVMHFAAWLSVGDSVHDPAGYYRNNVVGTLSLLDAMVRESVGRFVFSSSCAVFGEPDETPIAEGHPTRPINAYGQTKLAVEHALPHYERAYGLRAVTLRYFNASGADPDGELGEDHDPEIHLIPRAIEAATGGRPLMIFGEDYPTPDGTCLRDYVHVTDLADAHRAALEALEAGCASTTYNLGNGIPHSVRQVVEAVSRVVGRPVSWQAAPRRAGDPAMLYASNTRIQSDLGWRPRYAALETIVETAWRWHRAHPRGFREGDER